MDTLAPVSRLSDINMEQLDLHAKADHPPILLLIPSSRRRDYVGGPTIQS